jgi:hypothetical protein
VKAKNASSWLETNKKIDEVLSFGDGLSTRAKDAWQSF